MKNLRKRPGGGYAAVVYVPKHLRKKAAKHFGSKAESLKEIVRGLDTKNYALAHKRKLPLVAEIELALAKLDDVD